MDTQKLKNKIQLKMPLTPKEYAYAVLYMGLNPDDYIMKTIKVSDYEKMQNSETNLPQKHDPVENKIIHYHIHYHL